MNNYPIPPSLTSAAIPVPKTQRKVEQLVNGVPKSELIDMVTRAAKNIKMTTKSRLTEEELADLLSWLSEGVTDATIISRMKKRYKRSLSPKTIISYKKKYKGRIAEVAQDLEGQAIKSGLSKKATRLRSLQRLAESYEEVIFDADGGLSAIVPKHILAEYREVLKLIAQESGDLTSEIIGDINFIGMSDDELKKVAAGKLAANKDFAVVLAEKAGVRPQAPQGEEEGGKNSKSR